MNNVIVVGVDGSETAGRAAEEAARLAAALGSTLHIVMAIDKSSSETVGVGADTWVVDTLDDAHSTAESIAGQLRSIVSEVSVAAEVGKPHDVLVAEATRLEARLIVVGNRRMQGIGRVLGSVANSVAHNAPCDVYIVKTV